MCYLLASFRKIRTDAKFEGSVLYKEVRNVVTSTLQE